MDQTTSAYQSILWHIGKRGQDTSLDCGLNLRLGRNYQKTIESKTEPLHNSTDFQRDDIRENAYFASTYRN
jgi:hypothetical protein